MTRFLTVFSIVALWACCSPLVRAAEPIAMPDAQRLRSSVDGGLRWLAENQITEGPDAGSWQAARQEYRPAVASLAGLAFLANGHLPTTKPYGEHVTRAIHYVISTATPDGYVGQGDRSGMYIHAICTLFALSYLGNAPDASAEPELAEWCRRSLQVIVESQKVRRNSVARGGWRYTPTSSESDVSVTCWQLLVLHAAKQCGYDVDRAAMADGLKYVNAAYKKNEDETAGFLYRPGISNTAEPAATGVAVFIKSLLEAEVDEKREASVAYLEQFPPTWGGRQYGNFFFFAGFYLTQGMFQMGDAHWRPYSAKLYTVLLDHQAGDGSWPFPADNRQQSMLAGPAYPTAMSVLMLSLDQQYLPTYQRQSQLY